MFTARQKLMVSSGGWVDSMAYTVPQDHDAAGRHDGGEHARQEALDACLLGGGGEVLLRGEAQGVDGADDNVDPAKDSYQVLDGAIDVDDAESADAVGELFDAGFLR